MVVVTSVTNIYVCPRLGNYIIQAAKQISLAQQCEANGNYHMAFTYFKSGIGTLITGVQGNYFLCVCS